MLLKPSWIARCAWPTASTDTRFLKTVRAVLRRWPNGLTSRVRTAPTSAWKRLACTGKPWPNSWRTRDWRSAWSTRRKSSPSAPLAWCAPRLTKSMRNWLPNFVANAGRSRGRHPLSVSKPCVPWCCVWTPCKPCARRKATGWRSHARSSVTISSVISNGWMTRSRRCARRSATILMAIPAWRTSGNCLTVFRVWARTPLPCCWPLACTRNALPMRGRQ